MRPNNAAARVSEATSYGPGGESRVGGPSPAKQSGTSHIALYIPELIGGGVEKRTLSLAAALAERGHRVDLVLCETDGRLSGAVSPQVRVVGLETGPLWRARLAALAADPIGFGKLLWPVLVAKKPSRSLAYMPDLVDYLRRERPAALLSAKPHPNLEAVWAQRLAGVPTRIIVSERIALSGKVTTSRLWKRRFLPPLIRRSYQQAAGIIAVSNGVADDLASVTGIPRDRIKTIYNPVVDDELLASAAAPLDHPWFAPDAPPVIIGAGRLHPDKDFSTLIKAFARVREQRPARLMILGEARRPERRDRLVELAAELGLGDDFALPGFVHNPYAYMSRAAVFVLSSLWEGLPGALVEALACGCPSVSTDCPNGPREVLEDGAHGPLVPMGDSVAMAEAILATLDDPPDRSRLRARGAQFSVEQAVDPYLEMLLRGG